MLPILLSRCRPGVKVEIVGRHQQLQAHLDGNFHVGHILFVLVAVPIVEVVYHFFEHNGAEIRLAVALGDLRERRDGGSEAVRSDQV